MGTHAMHSLLPLVHSPPTGCYSLSKASSTISTIHSLPLNAKTRRNNRRAEELHCSPSPSPSPSPSNQGESPPPPPPPLPLPPLEQQQRRRDLVGGESTDWIASSLTRRFGLGAGLAWVAFLAFGVISEQIKTRNEVSLQEKSTRDVEEGQEVILPGNIRYTDLRIGGGSSPQRGDLVVVDLQGKVASTGEIFIDTFSGTRRSIAFVFGGRPYTGGICNGLEQVLQTMKAGGKRKVRIPPEFGFGETGEDFGAGVKVPPASTLEYIVQLQRVSIAPS